MRPIVIALLALAGCASPPSQRCVTAHTPAVSVTSTDPRIPAIDMAATVTTVCVTPAYAQVSDK